MSDNSNDSFMKLYADLVFLLMEVYWAITKHRSMKTGSKINVHPKLNNV